MTGGPNPGERQAPRRRRRVVWPLGSRLGRLIIVLNLLGLAILIGGALVLNEFRAGLIQTRLESLELEGDVIAKVIDEYATIGEPQPALEADYAASVVDVLSIPSSQRARLFDASGRLLADSYVVADRVDQAPLPPALKPGQRENTGAAKTREQRLETARNALTAEVKAAMRGEVVRNVRIAEDGKRVVSVSIPIRHVQAVLGVLTLQATGVEEIVAAQRRALLPFILIAIGVTLISSLLLTQLIAEPVLRLARAADRVRLQHARAIALPDLARRDDELGDLSRSLEDMTRAIAERMQAIERFAADVAHELRNPMTSIRSAVETLELVEKPEARARLLRILALDISRMDRLITDISNASRLDAELAREQPSPLDLRPLLAQVAEFYEATRREGEVSVRFIAPAAADPVHVNGREGPLGQVLRNLIDNARSFGQPGSEVRINLIRGRVEALIFVDDDGPGIPADNLEAVFQRFYTSRPKGAAFGGNSGLGLAIARQIIEAHGGRVWAENRLDADGRIAGARFCIGLPLV
ncbi:MAG TPA: ATP-binding protein [Caulobacteraceae bacterium]|jgi:two-component system sensor histidine kinase ChvG|nr:ATP-binding protein [Caulobacteraceae bacterium]